MRVFAAAFFALMLASGVAQAQPYPAKQVHIVVAYPPGGGTDISRG